MNDKEIRDKVKEVTQGHANAVWGMKELFILTIDLLLEIRASLNKK